MIKDIAIVVSLVGSGVGGYIYIDDKKADEVNVASALMEQRLETLDYQLDQKTREIARLRSLKDTGQATPQDIKRLYELEADKEWLMNRKSTLRN